MWLIVTHLQRFFLTSGMMQLGPQTEICVPQISTSPQGGGEYVSTFP
jgi:hypothetical protein